MTQAQNEGQRTVCRSVFKSGESMTSEKLTQKWIELINALEKNKRTQTITAKRS